MKIVVGHKVLNLEELTHVSHLGKDLAEVVVDSQLYAELSTAPLQKAADPQFSQLSDNDTPLVLSKTQIRAALLAKLVQILKLKKNAQKSTVDFLLSVLN